MLVTLLTGLKPNNERMTQSKFNLGYVLRCGEGGPQTPLPGNRGCLLAMVASNDCSDHVLSLDPQVVPWGDRSLAPGSSGSEDPLLAVALGRGTAVRTLSTRQVSRHSPKISRPDPAPTRAVLRENSLRLLPVRWGGAPPCCVWVRAMSGPQRGSSGPLRCHQHPPWTRERSWEHGRGQHGGSPYPASGLIEHVRDKRSRCGPSPSAPLACGGVARCVTTGVQLTVG